MDVFARLDAGFSSSQEIGDLGFHGDRLQAINIEQLLFRQKREPLVNARRFCILAKFWVGLYDAYNFIVGRLAKGLHFTAGVRVSDTDLSDFDLIYHAGSFRL